MVLSRENPQQLRAKERVDLVLHTAKDILAERGYSGLTLSAVCERAKIKQTSIERRKQPIRVCNKMLQKVGNQRTEREPCVVLARVLCRRKKRSGQRTREISETHRCQYSRIFEISSLIWKSRKVAYAGTNLSEYKQ